MNSLQSYSTDIPVIDKVFVYCGVEFVQEMLHFTQDLVDSRSI
jgi:hypothetical protein